MGTQINYSFGYGIKAPANRAHIDFWDEVEDNFPLLEYCIAGDHWNNSGINSMIIVKSSMISVIGYGMTPVGKVLQGLDSAGQLELERFIATHAPKAKADYMIWSYIG